MTRFFCGLLLGLFFGITFTIHLLGKAPPPREEPACALPLVCNRHHTDECLENSFHEANKLFGEFKNWSGETLGIAKLKQRCEELEKRLSFWERYIKPLEDRKYGYSAFLKHSGLQDSVQAEAAYEIITDFARVNWIHFSPEETARIVEEAAPLYATYCKAREEKEFWINHPKTPGCVAGLELAREDAFAAEDALKTKLFDLFGADSYAVRNLTDPRSVAKEKAEEEW